MKQKIFMTMLLILLVLTLSACSIFSTNNEVSLSETNGVFNNLETKEEDEKLTIKTKHFSIKIPKEWEDICSYETDDMSISFTHKKSNEYFQVNYGLEGGYLFSIYIKDLSFYSDIEAEILGGLSIPNIGEFNVWKLCASDVQSEGPSHEEYVKCMNEVDNIVSTISFNDEYHFSKTPYEIEKEEIYVQPPSSQQQTNWPPSANFSWSNLLNIGAQFDCDPDTDMWYATVGNRVCFWVPTEKMWMTEYEILFETYYLASSDGTHYILPVDDPTIRAGAIGFDRTLIADGSLIVE